MPVNVIETAERGILIYLSGEEAERYLAIMETPPEPGNALRELLHRNWNCGQPTSTLETEYSEPDYPGEDN